MAEVVKVGMVSLGCPKNQCDAELMLAKIADAGYKIVNEAGLADVVIINTCGFIQSAKEEAIEEIMEAINRKEDGINKKIIVTGCLAERYQQQMDEEFPEIDAVLGIAKNDDIVEAINSVLLDKRVIAFGDKLCHNMEGKRLQSTLPHYAYLRIADGCSNCCSYCAIPMIRGKMRSRKMENIIEEAKTLAADGVKELVIVAQDVTAYGIDLYKKYALPELLKELCKIDGIKWIRLLYCYPERITDELIEVIKTEEKVLNYIDVPIQHCNDEILKAMNRKSDKKSLTELFEKLRREIPDIVLRTTLITGFPGETEEQFTELAEFVNEVKFQRLGCFAYSEEEDTPAAEMPYQVDEGERQRRADIITNEQEIRMGDYYADFVDKEFEVVCEGFDRYSDMYFGRSMHFAPEIDGMIYFISQKENRPTIGDFIKVKITDILENNLLGEQV
ncbi:MAG: 30S ribosomal protein S12 methylthiotransferase RimO [Ruminococcaceae bacterium]|nr:30S ribosomal protein S12 methylthiotransferase RimO [Oscillospiraceae bacterium]